MLYLGFLLSLRSVEDLLHERGVDVSYEKFRYWWQRLGPTLASKIRKRRVEGMRLSLWRWRLDEMFVKVHGETYDLWRAIDHEGEVLESFVPRSCDRATAQKFLRKAIRKYG